MKVKLIKIEDGEVIVPLTLKVPERLYKKLIQLVKETQATQKKSRKEASSERKDDKKIGQIKTSDRLASKQSVILSLLEHALNDRSFKIETD